MVKISVLIILIFSLFSSLKLHSTSREKEFPIIMLAVKGTDNNFLEVKKLGVSYVHLYGLSSGSVTENSILKIKNYLDLAQKYNLKVLFDLDVNKRISSVGLSEIVTIVNLFKNHPSLGYWYLSDEPDSHNISAKDLLPFYKKIKEISPDIPIAICHAWTKNWYTYTDVQDILLHDTYPVFGNYYPMAQVDVQTRFTKAALKVSTDTRVIPVLQFFNWSSIAPKGVDEFKGFKVEDLRYPNCIEFRYLCFSTMAQGVNGLAFYSFAREQMLKTDWKLNVAIPVLDEVKLFLKSTELLDFKRTSLIDNDNSAIVCSYWKTVDINYYIIANATNKEQNIYLDFYDYALQTFETWGNTRSIDIYIKNKKLVLENVKPWEVIILKQS